MHAFFVVFTLFSFTSLFLSSIISLSILSISCLSRHPPIYGYCFYFYRTNPMRFLFFTPIAHQLLLSVMNNSSKLPTNLLAARPPLHLGMPSTFSLFHYPFHDKFQFVWFCREPFIRILMGKVSLSTYLSGMHQVVSTIYYLFWKKMSSQQSISLKRP